jgi:trehalose/maltose hydrolase-like predicted phosphorylase
MTTTLLTPAILKSPAELADNAVRRVLETQWDGVPAVRLDSPPGAGKTGIVERLAVQSLGLLHERCGHGSSLSRGTHALVAARLGEVDLAERYFHETAAIDLEDTTGTGAGGVHMAALGGLWQAAVFGFAGLGLREDGLDLDPRLPAGWRELSFRIQWRGRQVHLRLERAQRLVTARLERGEPLMLRVGGRAQVLQPWEPWTACWDETSS